MSAGGAELVRVSLSKGYPQSLYIRKTEAFPRPRKTRPKIVLVAVDIKNSSPLSSGFGIKDELLTRLGGIAFPTLAVSELVRIYLHDIIRSMAESRRELRYTISIYFQCINSVNQVVPRRGKMPRLRITRMIE